MPDGDTTKAAELHHLSVHGGDSNANVSIALAERDAILIEQNRVITAGLERLGEQVQQIDQALTGNRLFGVRGLVESVERLWAVVIGMMIVFGLVIVLEIAQWFMLVRIWGRL